MQALSTITGFLVLPFRQWRKRHAPKQRQQPKDEQPPFEYHRAEFVEGEWWVLSSSGDRLTPYGTDGEMAKKCAAFVNNRVNERLAEYARTKANRERIRQHVRESFDYVRWDGGGQ